MNDILGIVGTVCICGAFYLMARKNVEENETLSIKNRDLDHKVYMLEAEIQIREKTYNKNMENLQRVCDKLKGDKKELQETILFDNNLLIQKTEMLGKGAKKYSEDQITIADLNQQLCGANMEVVELKCTVEGMVKRGFVKLERAKLLGGVVNV